MALIGDALPDYALISSPIRMISFLIPDVTVEEVTTDDLAVTDHPVERGAAISDHAFKLPCRVDIRCGWSNSSAGTEGYVQEINEALLSIQAQREPFTVYTGKRVLQSMLLTRIGIETGVESEYALNAILSLREVIITQTQTTGADNSNQAMPERTGSVTETGNVSPVQQSGSATGIGNTAGAGSFGLSGPVGTTSTGIGTAANGGSFGDVPTSLSGLSSAPAGGVFSLTGPTGVGAFVSNAPGQGSFGLGGPSGSGFDTRTIRI